VLPIGAGWFAAFAVFRGRFLPTWLVGTTLGVAIRTVVLGHYRWNVLAFLLVTLVFLGAVAGLMRIAVRRLGH
jgi:hypothetical protein